MTFPSQFQLLAATNPCPCGFRNDRLEACRCTGTQLDRYRARFSGPLLDRFDLRVAVERLAADELSRGAAEGSAAVRERVVGARAAQERRGTLNRSLSGHELDRQPFDRQARLLLVAAANRSGITARGWDRLRRVARTIADLGGDEGVTEEHMAEALAMRGPL